MSGLWRESSRGRMVGSEHSIMAASHLLCLVLRLWASIVWRFEISLAGTCEVLRCTFWAKNALGIDDWLHTVVLYNTW
jgi:hypothetical protein